MGNEPAQIAAAQAVLEAFVAVAGERDERVILQRVLDVAARVTGAAGTAAVTVRDGAIEERVEAGTSGAAMEAIAEALARRAPLWRRDAHGGPVFAAPATMGDEVVGGLGVAWGAAAPGGEEPGDVEERFLVALARQTGTTVAAARLLARVEQLDAEVRGAALQRRQFMSTVSHELRTPVTSVLGFASVLTSSWDRLTSEEQHEYVAVIDRQARRLGRLVDDLLEITNIDAGVLAPEPAACRIRDKVMVAVEALGMDRSEFTVDVPDSATAWVDPRHIDRILVNLLSNAAKHGAPPLEVRTADREGTVEVSVRDHGPGVAPDMQTRLFSRFTRGRAGKSGSGLGLAVVKGLADGNGGSAFFEPAEGGGAVFGVRLPKNEP